MRRGRGNGLGQSVRNRKKRLTSQSSTRRDLEKISREVGFSGETQVSVRTEREGNMQRRQMEVRGICW